MTIEGFQGRAHGPRLWRRWVASALAAFALAAGSASGAGVEPWADPGLPVRDGLRAWLDAGRRPDGVASASDAPLAAWPDASGEGRSFEQPEAKSRPRLVEADGRAFVRFDGVDDFLEAKGLDAGASEATAFLVVAPTTNLGMFRGLLAGAERGRNDYTSGLTIDLGPFASTRLDAINVEGRGFQGFFNVVDAPRDFREFVTIMVRIGTGPPGAEIATTIDGRPQQPRPRRIEPMRLDRLTLGARLYSNEARPPYVQGFLHGDLAEVLLYDRALPDAEADAVRDYLDAKHRGLTDVLRKLPEPDGRRRLELVENPPPFQMLVPGFEVFELPLDLKNVNNVRRRPDGKLLAVGYDGMIHLLSDTDGDGLEDRAEVFWDGRGSIVSPLDAALTPPGYPLGAGLFIPCKGKCVLIVDGDGDDRADREIVVAEGWPELVHSVDAMGVALAPDGSILLGTGCQDFVNAYQLDPSGEARYDVRSERGAILKVSPDFKSREIVATGVRFSVGLEFNAEGDLFATDQEGATWLPNGNPFDELLHIRAGRHYGFPARHARHLPDVIDEPSTFDYAPQHQSTCGLTFNGMGDEPRFGPSWWGGDALVTGYSRGKLYRTHLVKVRGEYVARTDQIATAGMLLIDACVGADGSLVVAAHSGMPDWGSGPEGKGKLYKIRHAAPDLPQPTLAWSSGPHEVRIAFDRPIDPKTLHDVSKRVQIEFGRAVAPADRFEALRPGYAVVAMQLAAPRDLLAVRSVGLSADRRTLLLTTDAQSSPLPHAITLPGLGRTDPVAGTGALPQRPETDLAFALAGVDARWEADADGRATTLWLPHLDLAAARGLTLASAEHDHFWADLEAPGVLTLRAQVRLKDLLRPAVQPGSTVDSGLPAEQPTLTVKGRSGTRAEAPGARVETRDAGDGLVEIALTFDAVSDDPIPIVVTCPTGPGATLEVAYHTNEDSRPRLLSPGRILVPWAGASEDGTPEPSREATFPPEFAGGDRRKGREVFLGAVGQCSKCHTVRGEGGRIGPDLSNLVERDFASVLRDVSQPSVAINPDYVTYQVALADGRALTGSLRSEGDRLHVGLTTGEEVVLSRNDVEELKPTGISTMPEGLSAAIGAEDLKHLMAFLLLPPPGPAPIHRDDALPPRSRAEWDAATKGRKAPADAAAKPLRITLAAGPKDHGVDEHDYPLWLERWAPLLRSAPNVTVREVKDGTGLDLADESDVIVWYSANGTWSDEQAPKLRAYLDRGGGLVVIHWGVNGRKGPDSLAELIGLVSTDAIKYRHGPLDLTFADAAKSPILAGLPAGLHLVDESYWNLHGDPSRIEILATAPEEGAPRPLMWTRRQGRGRVFVSIPGHYTWTFDDPLFRLILLRAISWTADQPVDRLIDLATEGARME
ncbi:ThuA domain-containing protein [Planctomyces sp. SH-PL62]|uniref:ThuA domain-containing protein n=1 Tax=Planctomyces sp. SH-PL62 TaxID=1636152 RepID=UPI00078CEC10|nr:ThuA domain-containing protein [Planctomyces sp. SH-PL62]AMV40463.1 Trehalose utilization [Planctomyces sp. SH-PL62]